MQFSLLWIIFLLCFYFTSARTSCTFQTAEMKGLLRGIRYFSQMFDEKEPEMQIGLPTDVKHVAHIGMDGPAANKPSWMTEFSAAPELSAASINSNQQAEPINSSQQVEPSAAANGSLPPLGSEKQKKSRRKASIGTGSPISSPKGSEKQSRRHRSPNVSMDSPSRDSSSHGRRNRNKSRGSSTEPSSQEQLDIPRKSDRKKSKASSGGSSTSSSRSKGPNSLPDLTEIDP